MSPYFEADPDFNEDDYVENVWIAQTYDGARWGIPWDSGAMLMAFNIDLFDEVGVPHPEPDAWMTWDEIIELAKVLTFDLDDNSANDSDFDPARVRQYGLRAGFGHGRPTYIWGNDAEIIADDGTMPMDSDAFIEAMNWLADLGLKHFVNPSPAYEAAGETSLQAGNVAMQHIGVWSLGRINQASVNWGTFPVPYNQDEDILRPLLAPVRLLPDRLSPGVLRFHFLGLPQQSRAADSCRSGYAAADPQRAARTVPEQ